MNTFFNRFNQDLITESQTLQTLLSVGYPANTSVIGSSPNKADELPMLRDFKESVQALERFFPINAEIDSVEMGKLVFMLYHHCIITSTDSFRSLGYWTDTNNVTILSRMESPMGLEEMLHNGKFETDSSGNFIGENTKKQRSWKDVCCTIPTTTENSNKAKVLRQNATYIMKHLLDPLFGGCINNMIGWYRDFPLSEGDEAYQFYYDPTPAANQWINRKDYTYSFPACNTDVAYDLLYNYRGYITAWFKFIGQIEDDQKDEQNAIKGTTKLYRHHLKLDFHAKGNNPVDDLLYLNKMESHLAISYLPQIINLRHAVGTFIDFHELLDLILLESLNLGNGLYRLDLLVWILKNYLGIAYNTSSGDAVLIHAEKNTKENAAAALTFVKTCSKILFPVAERLFFRLLYGRASNPPAIASKNFCRNIYHRLCSEICGKYHKLYLTRITTCSDKYSEFFNALQSYFLDQSVYPFGSDQQSMEHLLKACQDLETVSQPAVSDIVPPMIKENSRKNYEDWKFIANIFVRIFSSSKSSEHLQRFITPDRLGFGFPADKQTKQQRSDLQNHIDQLLLS